MAKIFITGITGFLGSNIAENLVNAGHDVIATYRNSSSRALCTNFENDVVWILHHGEQWVNKIIDFEPEIIIHCAWIGVEHTERDVWEMQLKNIDLVNELLFIAKASSSKKIICLGSQAEYGLYSGCISEDHALNPTEAYGAVKIVCSELVKQFCNYHKIDWFWLRLFSLFGKGESEKWLIPTLINNLLSTDSMDFTPGEQKYAYLYVNDFATAINKIITVKGTSGIYNISGKHLTTLKNLIIAIRELINPAFKLNFSKLEYRANQSMHMQGDTSKFVEAFDEFEVSDFKQSLALTVNYIREGIKKRSVNESI